MKVGNLVKFRLMKKESGPCGVVIGLSPLGKTALIHWACSYTPHGNYQTVLLEVIDENR